MKRKLQVFISSTYDDMHLERQAVVEEILKCGHIPAGMELFGSDNKSQFEIIKKWISNCDVFLLILGGRYGSVSRDGRISKSYIHREYEYAKSIGKKPYALIMSDELIHEKVKNHIYSHEHPEYLKSDYKNFRRSISDKKLCEFFSSIDQLKEQVNAVIRKCEEEIELTEEKISSLEEDLSLPENSSDYEKISEISSELEVQKLHLDSLLEDWEKLSGNLSETEEKIIANGGNV